LESPKHAQGITVIGWTDAKSGIANRQILFVSLEPDGTGAKHLKSPTKLAVFDSTD
jgi:hypothetical protein